MALRPCLHPTCTELCTGTRCDTHRLATQRTRDNKRGPRPWYAGDWAKIRKAALQAHPYCAHCGTTDDLTVDHIRARTLDHGVQVLCRPCNAAKGNR